LPCWRSEAPDIALDGVEGADARPAPRPRSAPGSRPGFRRTFAARAPSRTRARPGRLRMTEDMQLRNLSPATQRSYLHQITQLARYFKKSPDMLGPPEIRSYRLDLIQEKELAPSSLLGAVSAIRFFYDVTLQRDWRLASNSSCTTPSARWRGYETPFPPTIL
jgi:hypothetical protein